MSAFTNSVISRKLFAILECMILLCSWVKCTLCDSRHIRGRIWGFLYSYIPAGHISLRWFALQVLLISSGSCVALLYRFSHCGDVAIFVLYVFNIKASCIIERERWKTALCVYIIEARLTSINVKLECDKVSSVIKLNGIIGSTVSLNKWTSILGHGGVSV